MKTSVKTSVKTFKTIALIACAFLLTFCAIGCQNTTEVEDHNHSGSSFKLGTLSIIAYDSEYVVTNNHEGCIAIYLHVENTGDAEKSVMGSYTVQRTQDGSTTLKVGIAYDEEGNLINTADTFIEPGEVKDVAMCFKLQGTNPVTVTFGNEDLGTDVTTLTFTDTTPPAEGE